MSARTDAILTICVILLTMLLLIAAGNMEPRGPDSLGMF